MRCCKKNFLVSGICAVVLGLLVMPLILVYGLISGGFLTVIGLIAHAFHLIGFLLRVIVHIMVMALVSSD